MSGRHRHPATRSVTAGLALLVALGVGAWLLAMPAPEPPGPAAVGSAPPPRIAEHPAVLPDGSAYTPLLFLDSGTSVGTALSPDRGSQRLLLLAKGSEPRQLHTIDAAARPGYNGVVSDGRRVVWAESLPGSSGLADTTFWVADVAGGAARRLTADTGDVVFFGSQYDLQIVDGRLYWAAQTAGRATELRSVPLTGGEVTVRPLGGAYALVRWPWTMSINASQSEPVTLREVTTGRTVAASAGAGEMLTCGATWCRVVVLGREGVARLDVMRPDGSQRRRVAGRTATPAVIDVMLLDRYEVLTTDRSALLLFDATSGRTLEVASAVGTVRAHGRFLWWTVGQAETQRWQVLDLGTL